MQLRVVPHHLAVAWHSRRAAWLLRRGLAWETMEATIVLCRGPRREHLSSFRARRDSIIHRACVIDRMPRRLLRTHDSAATGGSLPLLSGLLLECFMNAPLFATHHGPQRGAHARITGRSLAGRVPHLELPRFAAWHATTQGFTQ